MNPLSPIYIDSRSGSGPVTKSTKSKKSTTRYRGLLEYPPLNLCSQCKSTCSFVGGSDPLDHINGTWQCSSNSTHQPICSLTSLNSADVFFIGNGWEGPLSIGIEVKSISDLLSSLQTGRLVNEQVPKLLADYDIRWLLVYGFHRPHPDTGVLQLCYCDPVSDRPLRWYDYQPSIHSRTLPHGYLTSRLLTLTSRGIHCHLTPTISYACYFLASLYRWWSKDRSEDEKHLQTEDRRFTISPTLSPDPELRKRVGFAMTLPGLSHERGLSAAKHFTSIEAMVTAPESEWVEVPGIGKVTARAIRRYLTGR